MKKIKILLVENIHPVAKEKLEEENFYVESLDHSPDAAELAELTKKFQVLGIRSKTSVTGQILNNPDLFCVGAFCIGTNQVDLEHANRAGIPVFNAPHSNTRSVAEMVIAEFVILARRLGDRNTLAHSGGWLKSADGAREIRGKTLGIVGYGHIGSQVSILAEAMGFRVIFFDTVKKLPLGNAVLCADLRSLLEKSDFVTLHVPETPQTKNLISEKELNFMKKGAFLVNASRGTVVAIDALAKAVSSKQLGGAALDVFPMEPSSNKDKFKSVLQGLPNVFLTPHIGGSTEEAQYAIGLEVAESFRRFLKVGSTSGAVNFPSVDLPIHCGTHRILNVHLNEPGVLGEINSVVSRFGVNIHAQYLSTDAKIGYLVMDVERGEAELLAGEIKKLPRSIKTRLVY